MKPGRERFLDEKLFPRSASAHQGERKIMKALTSRFHSPNANPPPAKVWSLRLGLGGGRQLGPADFYSTSRATTSRPIGGATTQVTYCYTIGKMQAAGTIKPSGAENVISKSAWNWKRTMEATWWDDGGHYTSRTVSPWTWAEGPAFNFPAGTNDITTNSNSSLDPTVTGGKIFILDAPGCPSYFGTNIPHNSEAYINFQQWATVTLDHLYPCSDVMPWQYQAQINCDLIPSGANPVVLNNVAPGHTPLPTQPSLPHK